MGMLSVYINTVAFTPLTPHAYLKHVTTTLSELRWLCASCCVAQHLDSARQHAHFS